MEHHRDTSQLPIESANREASVTGLLDCLLDKNYTAANEHGGMRTIRSLLEDSKELAVPVVDLVAILPDLKSQARRGLHIASYYALDDKNWYPELLTTFFTRGVGGSLLALRQFAKCIGEYRVQRATKPRGKAKPLKADLVSMSAFFPPHPKILDYSVNDRFNEYSNLLFNHFDDHAAVVWVCFGPRGENSIQWAGSLFLLVRPLSGTESVSYTHLDVYKRQR